MRLSERVGRRMKLQDLHVFMTVAQAGSMRKAAQSLNTVQPAISRSIADLEQTLGVRLLDRHRQGVSPTEYGRALIHCGVAVFDDLRQGVKNIEFLADPAAGEARIGCNPFIAASFVSNVIDKETQDKIDIIKGRLIKNYGYNEASATDVLAFVASIFARGDVKD